MAQNVLIAGALFPDVPSISVPDQSNNWHSYVDTSDANATADDILSGKTAYVNGVKLTGTGQGGGGTSSWTKIGNTTEVTVNTTSTSNQDVITITTGLTFSLNKIIYVKIRDKAGKRSGYYYGSDNFVSVGAGFNPGYVLNFSQQGFRYESNGYYRNNNNAYGVYAATYDANGIIKIRSRYNASSTTTINGTFTIDVYTLDYPSGVIPF